MKNIHWQLCNHIKSLVAWDLNPRPFSHCLLNHSIHSLIVLIGSVQLNVAMLRGYNFLGNGWNVFCFVFLLSDSQCKLIVVWLFFWFSRFAGVGLLSLSLFLFSSWKSLDDYQINDFLEISHYYPLMIPFYFVGTEIEHLQAIQLVLVCFV